MSSSRGRHLRGPPTGGFRQLKLSEMACRRLRGKSGDLRNLNSLPSWPNHENPKKGADAFKAWGVLAQKMPLGGGAAQRKKPGACCCFGPGLLVHSCSRAARPLKCTLEDAAGIRKKAGLGEKGHPQGGTLPWAAREMQNKEDDDLGEYGVWGLGFYPG